ncbi:hypothetical protein HDC37_000846 [Microbacterium sp. AK009]|uniref:DEAD/DEAH box helicase n=1 Tax=Microbacterium sp. AK009 TaxID=2723068 RepID=UPI0015CCD3FD|nr:DEAD/DEAH box helicase [Microbacterium sp. AK009]NYF16032.1 hypothetical protein [Microbacterium sp. AK009]
MSIDLSRLGGGRRTVKLFPRDIFDALPSKPWSRLRPEQSEVLKSWFETRTRQDTVIKQNTGGGKTAVGLLIAQSSLNEGVSPAMYLTPDTYLAKQVVAEAELLGIPVVTKPSDPSYRAGEAILVTTFEKLINGRSTFGISGSGRPIQHAGTIVVDDAHAALARATKQFKVLVPRGHEAYRRLGELFSESLRLQSATRFHKLNAGEATAPIRVPFWTWASKVDAVRDILRPSAEDEDENWLFYPWPIIEQVLELCVATVDLSGFEIRPICPPVDLIPAFAQARRRVYLTATLADDGILVTELGASPDNVTIPVTPERASDLGDRLILAPLSLNPSLDPDAVRQLAQQFSVGDWNGDGAANSAPINVIVLVPSDARAAAWARYANVTCHVNDMKPVVERLKNGEHIGVVVLVNKYDGVDLPGPACRLLILDGVPFPLSPSEIREAGALAGTDTFAARQVQKIEQGMGRGIRDVEDYSAVLLMGSDLAMTLKNRQYLSLYSPATRAQIELSSDLASQIEGAGLNAVRQALTIFLNRDQGWVTASRDRVAGVEYDSHGTVSALSRAQRRAFDLARAGQYPDASQTLLDGTRGMNAYEAAWFKEDAAHYAHLFNSDRAQAILRDARLANNSVLQPLTATPVRVLRPTGEQARQATGFLTRRYESGVELELGFQAILEEMVFDESRVPETEEAFEHLGLHLGFASERPDKIYSTGPDVLWIITEDLQFIIELKTGITRADKRITKDELDQLSGHVSWHRAAYPATAASVPVLVHPEATHLRNGTPPPGTRVLTPASIDSIKARVHSFATAIAQDEGWKSETAVRQALTTNTLTGRNALLGPSVSPAAAT